MKSFNCIYFAFLFIVLSVVHVYHVILIDNGTLFDQVFYMVYAFGQTFLEVAVLALIGYYLSNSHRVVKSIFVVLTFIALLIHLLDLPLIRIMGMSIWFAADFITGESYENFLEMLLATHISLTSWLMAGVCTLLVPLLGLMFYRITEKWSKKINFTFSPAAVQTSLFSVVFSIGVLDFAAAKIEKPHDAREFARALPWKTTLFPTACPQLPLIQTLAAKSTEAEYLTQLKAADLKIEKKPNIFLFVVESLREDFIYESQTPALAKFKEENTSFEKSLAGANYTQGSWFSIFHSVYPFQWGARPPKTWHAGSLPLQILKKAGYQIDVYSASRLGYYQMDERIFGKGCSLADHIYLFGEEEQENHLKDRDVMQAVTSDAQYFDQGHLFIIFLESTHFGYSFPKCALPHCPTPESIDYFAITCSNNPVVGVKNRYRNAVHFIDSLFGSFFEALSSQPSGKEAVVVVTGDHGEEFFEEGRVFHASHLSPMQTRVPIFYRLPEKKVFQRQITSHLDIFPTVLHYVLGKDTFETWFDGQSILSPAKKQFAISARYNASRTPYEFLIHTGKDELVAQFNNHSDVFRSNALEIISHRNPEGTLLDLHLDQIQETFKEALDHLFTH